MAAGQGQRIDAVDYSSIKAKVDSIFGEGAGQSGYGQTVTSPGISLGTIIRQSQWNSLRSDMVKTRQHQTGITVGTSNALDGNNLLPIVQNVTLITEEIRAQYNAFADRLITDKFQVHSSQLSSLEVLATKSRTTFWSGTLNHTVTITGSSLQSGSSDNIRYFFNAGGKIVISAARSGGSSTNKNNNWTTFLASIGEVIIDYTSTTTTSNVGSNSAIGWYDLTIIEQLVFSHSGTDKTYKIYARRNLTSTQLILRIEFFDSTSSDPIMVDGTLVSEVKQYRPVGDNVTVLTPSATQAGLDEVLVRTINYTPTVFNESVLNNGTITGTSTITVQNDIFNASAGQAIPGVTFTNVPAGLTPVLTRSNTFNNVATLSFTGSATSNNISNNVSNLTLNFGTQSFVSGVVGSITYGINFRQPIYQISGSPTNVEETGTVTFTITSSDVPPGTLVYYTIQAVTGVFGPTDFASGATYSNGVWSGSLTINSSTETFSLTLNPDILTEGVESFIVELRSGSVSGPVEEESNIISVTDSSRSAVYTITSPGTSVDEGGSIVFTITGTDIPPGTPLFWEIVQQSGTITANDFVGLTSLVNPLNNNVLLTSYTGNLTLNVKLDNFEEPITESFRLRLRSGSESGNIEFTSNIITIGDVAPTLGGVSISVVDETSSTSESTMNSNWAFFRNSYPTRKFVLLQPILPTSNYTKSSLRIPADFNTDPNSSYFAVIRESSTSGTSDWFSLAGLSQYPAGTKILLSVDKSGSMTLNTVQRAYNQFLNQCLTAGLLVTEVNMGSENWIAPHIRNL